MVKMKLTCADKEQLLSWGHPKEDFPQIEEALQKRITKYELCGKKITREEAISILGRKKFLSGISRSAFHYTATQILDDGRVVYFDSSNLFR